jgi:2-hydroxycyclohexanecarboxyl-CoA dehydrogenase
VELNLKDHVVVVTGGASGIGRAIAAGFAAEACKVALWDASPKVADVAREFGGAVLGCEVDVTDQAAVGAAVQLTETKLGRIEHLVHAAAIPSGKFGFPFTNLTPADWTRVMEVNVMGMVNVAHAIAPLFTERKRGTMVFIASVAGQVGSQTDPPYSASKAANINFAMCLAKDLAEHGVRVNTVCPGMIQTPLNRGVWQASGDSASYEEWFDKKVQKMIPLKRPQSGEDIANMVVFLSSERAGQVTGQTINVDGGYVMHW